MSRKLSFAGIMAVVLLLAGCATLQKHQGAIDTFASSAGYATYRAVPEARPILISICLLEGEDDPAAMQTGLKKALGKVWSEASKLRTQDAQMAILALNTLVGMLGIQDDTQAGMEVLKTTVAAICKGCDPAQGRVRK